MDENTIQRRIAKMSRRAAIEAAWAGSGFYSHGAGVLRRGKNDLYRYVALHFPEEERIHHRHGLPEED
jgi:hypothetical protein